MRIKDLRLIFEHPLNTYWGMGGVYRYLRLGLKQRLGHGEFEFPFVGGSRLRASCKSRSAQLQYYNWLSDFEEMSFTLHFLRSNDLFLDAGANVGVYTVMAAAVAKCRVVAFEPAEESLKWLRKNVELNHLEQLVELHKSALGAEHGVVRFTQSLDTVNRVQRATDQHAVVDEVPLQRLDDVLGQRCPALLKIDVEGFELPVLQGAMRTLADSRLKAILIETNGLAAQYGIDEARIHEIIQSFGFERYNYDAFTRLLVKCAPEKRPHNSLYLRDAQLVQQKLKEAEPFVAAGRKV